VDNIDQQIGFAKQLLFQSIEQMEVDPVFGVLRDSTISFPAITNIARATGSGLDRVSVTHHSPPAKLQANTGPRSGNRSKSPLVDFFDKLKQAQDHLKEAHSVALQVSSTSVIQKLSSLLNTIAIFLSAAGSIKGRTTVHTNFAACSIGRYYLQYRYSE
jgi:separase